MKIINPLIKNISGIGLGIICSLLIVASGCRREEFMPPAEGSQVPYADTVRITLKEALAQSPAKLFYLAWQRSHMDIMLAAVATQPGGYTILALSDEALQAGGYTAAKLQSMDPKDIDSLLLFYTLRGRIDAAALKGRSDNLITLSLLKKPELRGMPDPDKDKSFSDYLYYFKQHLQVREKQTYVNGKVVGSGISIPAKDGYIWLLDKMVPKPDKTLLQVVEADGRFTMLLELMQRRDALYKKIYEEATGWPASHARFSQFHAWELRINPVTEEEEDINVLFTTIFLPTNEAFKAAGFNTVDDLMAFNERRGLPQYVDWSMKGLFATDSLLDFHINWGYIQNGRNSDYPRNISFPVFYSNMFGSSTMPRLMLQPSLKDPNGVDYVDDTYYMPLEFSKDAAGKTLVKVKGSGAPAAMVTESDIPTFMGPLHVVDRLLIPKGYKLN
ncbi:hypothetical protein [Chitinophaga nivalis]|uniref:FAS1 domain-containing protein n=1 Tax=Chitinophaga nivalis TaxID=2991709 RepID=A0ABT3IJ15_9BACT|nr:hypothetical protein [Chitinophaga nivalis]MCW3466380.1 hypothetical protein [Chitinophaga nivalis]MCW3483929.1 hypothetical protein [Chitinophaga nivalis]